MVQKSGESLMNKFNNQQFDSTRRTILGLAGVAADNRDAALARALSAAAEEGHLRTSDAPVLERLLRGTVGLRDEGAGTHNVERGHTEEAAEMRCSVTCIDARAQTSTHRLGS